MSQKKLWGGRFAESSDAFAEEFGASIFFDKRLAPFDIQGSIAHATMLGETGIIPKEDATSICTGLKGVRAALERGELEFKVSDEDIHMNIERYLHAEIGPVAGKLHTARSRNDQVATDFHLFIRHALVEVAEWLGQVQQTLLARAREHLTVVMPGYTHLQPAQPVLFSHHLLAYVQMLDRDTERLFGLWSRANILPLGAGALAGTTFPIDRNRVAQLLGFDGVYENSMDAVSDRDFVLEFLSSASILQMHLSRLCEEIIIWSTAEFAFIELSDKMSTGSSIMPQKKNADFAELVRGKTGRVYGSLLGLLTTLKGLPLTYNKDMQEDKEGAFDTFDTVVGSLRVVNEMVKTMRVREERMSAQAEHGFINATDAADYLAKKGLPFREAHEVVGSLVAFCISKGQTLGELTLTEYKQFSPLFDIDIFEVIKLDTVVNRRTSYGGTARSAVEAQLERISEKIMRSQGRVSELRQVVGVA
jgi:argininosuccinate lyase